MSRTKQLYLYLQQPSGSLASYRIGRDGSLTLTGHIDPQWPPVVHLPAHAMLAVQPGGGNAYSTPLVPSPSDREQERVQKYRIDQGTGSLIPEGAVEPSTQASGALLFSPSGDVLYVWTPFLLPAPFRLGSSGNLIPVKSRSDAIGRTPGPPVFSPTGPFAYVLMDQANSIASYSVASDGSLSPAAKSNLIPTGAGPDSLVIDPAGQFAYAANSGDGTVSEYVVDPATGTLRPNPKQATVPVGPNPGSLAIDASGRFLYGINASHILFQPGLKFTIFRFRIQDDGVLASLGKPLEVAGSVTNYGDMMADPSGRFVYARVMPPWNRNGENPETQLLSFRIGSDGRLEPMQPPLPILENSPLCFSWIGSRPSVRIVHRDTAPLLSVITPVAGTFASVGPMLKPVSSAYYPVPLPDGRVFFLEFDPWLRPGAEIYNPRNRTFAPAHVPGGIAGANVEAELPHSRFLLLYQDQRVQIFDAAGGRLTDDGHLSSKCVTQHWVLDDGRVLFHYGPGIRQMCGGEIFDPRTGKSVDEPAELRDKIIVGQLRRARFLVFPRPLRMHEINPYALPGSIAVSVYDLKSQRLDPVGQIPGTLAYYNQSVLLKDGRLLLVSSYDRPADAPDQRSNFEVFDPQRRSFTTGVLSQPHGSGVNATVLKDGRVLIAGGFGRTNAEVLDPATMTSTPTGTMIQHQYANGILLNDGTVLFVGGAGVFGGRVVPGGHFAETPPPDIAEIYNGPS